MSAAQPALIEALKETVEAVIVKHLPEIEKHIKEQIAIRVAELIAIRAGSLTSESNR